MQIRKLFAMQNLGEVWEAVSFTAVKLVKKQVEHRTEMKTKGWLETEMQPMEQEACVEEPSS